MGVTFRDESNGPSPIMIGYSDATVTTPKLLSNNAVKDPIIYNTCYSTIIMKIVK